MSENPEIDPVVGVEHAQAQELARIYWALDTLAAQKGAPPGIRGIAGELLDVYDLNGYGDLPEVEEVSPISLRPVLGSSTATPCPACGLAQRSGS